MKITLFLTILFFVGIVFSQERGEYRYNCAQQESKAVVDSVPRNNPPHLIVDAIEVMRYRDEILHIKRFGRFELEGSRIITAYGMNTDNPTIYGRFKVKGDTLILHYKKSIQHFNKLAPKRRVKKKFDYVEKYVLINEQKFQDSENCFWQKTESDK